MSVDRDKLETFSSKDLSEAKLNKTLNRMYKELGNILPQVIAIEELSELIKVVTKHIRFKNNRDDAIEEIADTLIAINLLYISYGITSEEILQMIAYKLDKINTKLDEGRMGNRL